MRKDNGSENDPIVIKKYANRRLYNTDTSTYVTLEDLAKMVRSERDFVVYDAKTGEELTHSVLTQIIVEQESKGQNLLPVPFLRQLIRFYGNSMETLVPSYLQMSLEHLVNEQKRYQEQFENALSSSPLEAMQEHMKNNMLMFEKTMSLFTPFSNPSENSEIQQNSGEQDNLAHSDDLEQIKSQMSDMQKKIDKLSQ